MARTKTAMLTALAVLLAQVIPVTWASRKVDILQNKIQTMEKSWSQDIELLRHDMKAISEDLLNRSTEILKAELSKIGGVLGNNGPEKQPEQVDKDTPEMKKNFDDLSQRIKRAFSEEKLETRKFISELRSEIDEFEQQMKTALSEVKETQAESVRILNEHTSGVMVQLKEVLNRSQADSVKMLEETLKHDISNNVNKIADKCSTGIHSMSQRYNESTHDITLSMRKLSTDLSSISDKMDTQNGDVIQKIEDKKRHDTEMLNSIEKTIGNMERTYYENDGSYRVRLANIIETDSTIGGRLEVRYSDEWGTVCDDLFGMNDATVACKMLGFRSAFGYRYYAQFGPGENKIWMDDVECSGSESSLFDCDKRVTGPDGMINCQHYEDVGVICHK